MPQFGANAQSSLEQQGKQCTTLIFHLPEPANIQLSVSTYTTKTTTKTTLPLPTILKYCVDCTQRSSRSPFNRNKRARNIEHMSILPITLKLGLCNKRSNCIGVNENGYWTPAFRPGLLSRTFTKSAFEPPQQMMVASPEIALNNRETRSI